MMFDSNYYFNYYLSEERLITIKIYEDICYPPLSKNIKKHPPDKSPDNKLDITELLVYIREARRERR